MSGYYLTLNDDQFLDLITDELNKYELANDTSLCVFFVLFLIILFVLSEVDCFVFCLQYSSFSTFDITSSVVIASASGKKLFQSIQFFGW
jgi:hypothetical protein